MHASVESQNKSPDARFSRIKTYIGVAIGVSGTLGRLLQCRRRRLAHDSPMQVFPTGGTLGIGGRLPSQTVIANDCCHPARPFGTRSDRRLLPSGRSVWDDD